MRSGRKPLRTFVFKLEDFPTVRQAWLRYHVSDALDLRASVSRYWGGETKLGGVSQDDETNRSKFTIGAAWFVDPSLQLIANVGRDISVDNGAKDDSRLNLRLLTVF